VGLGSTVLERAMLEMSRRRCDLSLGPGSAAFGPEGEEMQA